MVRYSENVLLSLSLEQIHSVTSCLHKKQMHAFLGEDREFNKRLKIIYYSIFFTFIVWVETFNFLLCKLKVWEKPFSSERERLTL